MNQFLNYFYIFFIYSILGWIIESFKVSIEQKKIINRGFLIGPYCPIYGCGALIIILYLDQYKNNIVTVFFLAIVLSSILEYLTSYMMEKIFKARWWDYSDKKFNLNGRICGENAILFGLCGIIIIYIIHPLLNNILIHLNQKIILFISIISLIIFLTDTIISFNIINRFKQTVTNIDIRKDSTQEFSKLVKETLFKNHKTFQKRLFTAFPNVNIDNLKKDIKDLLKNKQS